MEEISKGNFREDLYYRLKVFPVYIPPLRERLEDIPILLNHFIEKLRKETGRQIFQVEKKAVDLLEKYSWQGNVRELENAAAYAFVVSKGPVLKVSDFPDEIIENRKEPLKQNKSEYSKPETRQDLMEILEKTRWNKAEAGRVTGLSRTSIWKYMKKWNIPLEKPV